MVVDVDVESPGVSPKNAVSIYPPEFWKLDPISQTNVKLFNKDYNNLKVVQYKDKRGLFYLNHLVNQVDVMGVVVVIDEITNNVKLLYALKYTIDDGSASIRCTVFFETLNDRDEWIEKMSIIHGTLVKIIGEINIFRGKLEIKFRHRNIWKIDDPNMELLRWVEIIKLKEEYYCKPFIVPKSILEKSLRRHSTGENVGSSSNLRSISPSQSHLTKMSHTNSSTDLAPTHQVLSLAPHLSTSTLLSEVLEPLHLSSPLQSNETPNTILNPMGLTSVVTDTVLSSDVIHSDGALSSTGVLKDDLSRPLTPINGFSALEDFLFLPNIFYRLTENQTTDFSTLNSSQITEDVFVNIIVRYIYEKQLLTFEFPLIRQAPVLIEYAVLLLRHQHDCKEPTPEQLTALFTRSLLALVNEEFLIFTDEERLVYKLRDEYSY